MTTVNSVRQACARLAAARRGNVAVMTALLLPAMIGGAGFASDTAQWVMMRRAMQRQVDSAALAGALAITQGADVSGTVTADLTKNNNFTRTTTTIETPPSVGTYAGNSAAVRVRVVSSVRLPFSGALLQRAVSIGVEATAAMLLNGEYCLLALDPSRTASVSMGGSTIVNASCGLHSNASGNPAITAGGSSSIFASPVSAVGNINTTSTNYAAGTTFRPYTVRQRDPYASIADPTISSSPNNGDVNPNQTRDLTPGNYRGMNIQGTANLAPGIYYIDGQGNGNNNSSGGLSIGSQAVVNGTGVTFVLTMRNAPTTGTSAMIAGMKVNGGATLNLTAPTDGTYKGILVYQDRRANLLGDTVIINGNATSKLEGAIYVPRNEVQMNGTTGMNINCMQIVGYRLTFTGNSAISNVCPATSGSGSFKGNIVRLVS